MNEQKKAGRTLVGQVVSNGMDKTISVLVERRVVFGIWLSWVAASVSQKRTRHTVSSA